MAFQGLSSLLVEQVTPTLVRLSGTGLNLVPGAVGTIGLADATGTEPDIRLPATFQATALTFGGQPVSLRASIRVQVTPATAGDLTNLPPTVAKTGTTAADFRIVITNTNANETTQDLEIYVESVAAAAAQSGEHVHVHIDADVDVG